MVEAWSSSGRPVGPREEPAVPAVRSRTENWRRSLRQLIDRGGSIELALPEVLENDRGAAIVSDDRARGLLWRVRILELSDDELVVEQPSALGRAFEFEPGVAMVGIIAIGQNRWMFRTLLKATEAGGSLGMIGRGGVVGPVMRLKAPETVERCQRRSFYRVRTMGLALPRVQAYALLDPLSSVEAEVSCAHEITEMQRTGVIGRIRPPGESGGGPLPEVGPDVEALLVNVGGGGVGLVFQPEHRSVPERYRTLWLRLELPPYIPAPLGVVGRVRHTHLDSEQRLYAGVCFEFHHNPSHERFVVDQLCRYVALVQRQQIERAAKLHD